MAMNLKCIEKSTLFHCEMKCHDPMRLIGKTERDHEHISNYSAIYLK